MRKKSAATTWLWSRIGDIGNIQLLASVGVGVVSAVWGFAQGFPLLSLVMLGLGCLVISIFTILGMQSAFLRAHAQFLRARCPLQVDNAVIRELERLKDADGNDIKDVYSVAFYLRVTGKPNRQDTLQNVSARMSSWHMPVMRLPCYDSGDQKIDIRHGEQALFRIGSVLVPLVDGNLPGTHMFRRDAVAIDRHYAEHILIKQDRRYRTLSARDIGGAESGFVQVEGQKRLNFGITVSADDVSSVTAWYRLNLLDPNYEKWIERLKGEPDDDLSD
jgi:hypothetical protein